MEELKTLNGEIRACKKCSLCNNGKVVIGRASDILSIPIEVMLIGEAPGNEEAEQGIPFCGRSGELLDTWIKGMNLYNYVISNVVKHRPIDSLGKNRTPTDEEVVACLPWLEEQIKIFKPKKILCLGKIAFQALTKLTEGITQAIENKVIYSYNDIPVFVYFHPAYILRNSTTNWQKDIEDLGTRLTGRQSESASKLWSTSGVKNASRIKELEESKEVDKEFENIPIIGLKTEYTLGKYGGKIDEEIKYLKQHSVRIVAVDDENTTGSFFKIGDLLKYRVKIIYGAKVVFKGITLSIFCLNQQGYINLNLIVSKLNREISFDLLDFTNGLVLVITSAEVQMKNIEEYKRISNMFSSSYVGYCSDSLSDRAKAHYLANELGLKMIFYQNNKFTRPEDYRHYLTISAIKNHRTLKEKEIQDKYENSYVKGQTDLRRILDNSFQTVLENTNEFSNLFNFELKKYHNLLPEIKYDYGEDASKSKEEQFTNFVKRFDLTKDIERYSKKKKISFDEAKKIYDERFSTEMEVIISKNFIDYLIVVRDIYDFVKKNDWTVGAGRGSVGGSLIAYMLGITQIEPIYNSLFFERFINIERPDLPDIDMDFMSSHRKEIIKYLQDRYGEDKIVYTGTQLTFKEKSALNDVAKVMGVPKYVVNDINNLLIKRTSGDARSGHILEQTFNQFPQLNKHRQTYPEYFDMVSRIEGQRKAIGTHASGIMILKDEYYNYFSLLQGNNNTVSCFEYPELESAGMVKLDILGLSALDTIDEVTKKNNIKVNYSDPANDDSGLKDERVFELFKKSYTAGIFEASTPAMTRMSADCVIEFKDIISLNSFCRPAPIRYGVPGKYKEFKKSGKMFSVGSELADKMLAGTIFEEYGGLIMFQEQIMIIFNKVAGFYSVHSNSAVKAISKSKGISTFFEQYGKRFIDGAVKNGIPEPEAKKIFDNIFQFGSFSFNLSHSTLYGYMIYYTAWLKVNFTNDYYISSYKFSNDYEKNHLVSEIMMRGFKIVAPDINVSDIDRLVYIDGIFYQPLQEIKHITDKQLKELISKRPFTDINDLFDRVKLSDRVKESVKQAIAGSSGDVESILKNGTTLPLLIQNKEKVIEEINRKIGQKTQTIKELQNNGKKGWIIALNDGNLRQGNLGDWLPVTEKPTEEELKTNPSKYGLISKFGWMAKWAKAAIKDIEGTDAYINIYPDIYQKNIDKLTKLKDGTVFAVELKLGRSLSERSTMLDLVIFNSDF